MAKLTVQKGQSLLDIALQVYGSVQGIFDLVERNKLNGITDNVPAGEEIAVGETPLKFRVQRFLQGHAIGTISPKEQADGIGWMRTGDTFIIT